MNNKGISIIGAVFTLLIMAIFGTAIVSLVSSSHEIRRRQVQKEQAFYASQAGLEYAIKEINDGGYPIATNKQIGRGQFTTAVDFNTHTITSTGASGDVSKVHYITYSTMGGDCLDVNNEQATLVGPGKTDMKAITLKKNCLDAITVDKMQISWAPDNNIKVTKIIIKNNTVYEDVTGAGSGDLIDIIDYSMATGQAHQISLIEFTGNMLNKDLVITFFLSDTTYKTISFKILPPNQS